jgi:hypothetical protein
MEDSSSPRVDDGEIELYSETIEIRRSILCIICLGTYFNPVRLPCSHTFCGHCILEASRVKLRCPICSAEFSKRSINRVPNISKVIADIDALVKSLTADNRFSIPIEKLDEQYRQRQRAVRSENQSIQLIPTPSLEPEICYQREIVSKSCGTIYGDVDTTSGSSVELVTADLSEFPSSSSNDGARVGPAQCVSGHDTKALSPLLLSNMPHQNQSPSTDFPVPELVFDSYSTDNPQLSGGTDYTSNKYGRKTAPISRKVFEVATTEMSDIITASMPSSSSINRSDLPDITAHILLSTETATATAQLALEKCSGTNITDAVFRPGEVVDVSSRMWPGQGISIAFLSFCV